MFRLAPCLLFALLGGLRADVKTSKPLTLIPGTVKVEGENLRCMIYRIHYVERFEERQRVVDGKPIIEKRKVLVPEYVVEERLIPLKGVQGQVVATRDKAKVLQPLDVTKLPGTLKKNSGVYFLTSGDKPEPMEIKPLKDGTIVLILPKPEKK